MADSTISALAAASALAGTEPLPVVQSATTKKALVSQIGTYVRGLFTTTPATIAEGGTNAATAAAARTSLGAIGEAPTTGAPYTRNNSAWQRTFVSAGYVSGNWYPADYGLSFAAGGAMSANTIYFSPLVIYQDVTITALMAEVATAIAASNFQLAIYAMDATTKLPIGAALTSTASMSAVTATQVSSTLGSPLALPAGMYWVAVNTDTAGIGLRALVSSQAWVSSYTGSAIMSHAITANAGRLYYTLAQTFNTWPTVVTVTEAVANNFCFIAAYKAQ